MQLSSEGAPGVPQPSDGQMSTAKPEAFVSASYSPSMMKTKSHPSPTVRLSKAGVSQYETTWVPEATDRNTVAPGQAKSST